MKATCTYLPSSHRLNVYNTGNSIKIVRPWDMDGINFVQKVWGVLLRIEV